MLYLFSTAFRPNCPISSCFDLFLYKLNIVDAMFSAVYGSTTTPHPVFEMMSAVDCVLLTIKGGGRH